MSADKSGAMYAQKKYGNIDLRVRAILAVGKVEATEEEVKASIAAGGRVDAWLIGFVPWSPEYEGVKRRVMMDGTFMQHGKRVKTRVR